MVPNLPDLQVLVSANVDLNTPGGPSSEGISTRSPFASCVTIDVAASSFTAMTDIGFNASRSALQWAGATGPLPADFVRATIEVRHSTNTTTTPDYIRVVAGPADSSQALVLPALPAPLAEFNILTTDRTGTLNQGYPMGTTPGEVVHVAGGWDAARNGVFGSGPGSTSESPAARTSVGPRFKIPGLH